MKGKTSLIVVITAIFVVASLIFAACAPKPTPPTLPTPTPPAPPAPIKVGMISDWSGPAAANAGVMGNAGIDYMRSVNDAGGINGVPIDIRWLDCEYKLPTAVSHYKRLKDEGIVVLWTAFSAAYIPLGDLSAADRIPQMITSYFGPALWPPAGPKWNFGWVPTFADQFAAGVDFVMEQWKEKRAPRIVFLTCDTPYGRTPLLGETAKYTAGKGADWVATEFYPFNPIDVTSELLKVKAHKPDWILSAGIIPEMTVLAKNYTALGLDIPLIHLYSGLSTVARDNPKICEGQYFIEPHYAPWDLTVPEIKKMQATYSKYRKAEEVPVMYLIGWGPTTVVVEALRLALDKVGREKLDGAAVYTYGFGRMKDFDTGLGQKVSYTLGVDHSGSHNAIMHQVKGGKVIIVKGWWVVPPMKA